MHAERTVEPLVEPLTLDEAKQHLRVIDPDNEDSDYISALITAARELVEERTGRALVAQTWRAVFDRWPGACIELPRPPLQSVASVKYYGNNTLTTIDPSAYHVDTFRQFGRVALPNGATWPTPDVRPSAIQITYVAGYGDGAEDVPKAIRQAMLLLIGHWYENRQAVDRNDMGELPLGVDALLAPYRAWKL